METRIMAVAMDPRSEIAPKAQEIFTKYGCIITTRLGIHEVSKELCSERGLILLHIMGGDKDAEALRDELQSIEGIKVNSMTI